MKEKTILRACAAICFLLILLTGCSQDTRPSPASQTAVPAVVTAHPTAVEASPAVDETGAPSITPLPTLPRAAAYATIESAIQPQDDCALPCWFGIVPGESSFEDVYNRFSQFSSIGRTALESNRLSTSEWISLGVDFPTHSVVAQAHRARGGKVAHFTVNASISEIKNERRVYGDPAFAETWEDYFLPNIFTKHGKPAMVFLDTTRLSADPSSVYPFVLWIVYPEQGFLIRYAGINEMIGDAIRICPLQSDLSITAWQAEKATYEQFLKDDRAMATSPGPQLIKDVTDFDVETFYNGYRYAEFDTCFETPASFWPGN